MDFGRLDQFEDQPHTLPTDDAITGRTLTGRTTPLSVRIGLPIWGNRQWVGRLYPKGTHPRDLLTSYARLLPTVEVSSTFYHPPAPEQLARWADAAPAGFRFCPKLPRRITHERGANLDVEIDAYVRAVTEGFGARHGATLVQLPPSLGPRDKRRVFEILRRFPADFPVNLELRHEGWFTDRPLRDRLFTWLNQVGIGLVITDTSGRRDAVHMAVTAPRVVIRFAGNSLHPSDHARVDRWAERISTWSQSGLQELYFFVHQPDELKGVPLINHLIARLSEHGVADLPPCPLVDAPEQRQLW